jgi:hypothetical protein
MPDTEQGLSDEELKVFGMLMPTADELRIAGPSTPFSSGNGGENKEARTYLAATAIVLQALELGLQVSFNFDTESMNYNISVDGGVVHVSGSDGVLETVHRVCAAREYACYNDGDGHLRITAF